VSNQPSRGRSGFRILAAHVLATRQWEEWIAMSSDVASKARKGLDPDWGGSPSPREHTEGVVARTIEEQTAKLPSDLFLWAAGASILGSLFLQINGQRERSVFVGQWAPTFLILGLYNKLVKVAGSDRVTS
jgi:hypothetical protein